MVVGLVAYALWQLVEAIWGHRGKEGRRRVGKLVGSFVKALVAAGFAATAVQLLSSHHAGGGAEEDVTARVLGAPGGALLVGAAGVVLVVLGGYWVT
ncbi:DUF1206 domain-containing protein, partial [Klebsiella pneumoniae]|nr:DUF1206 domain-containing protein [Klebsiella pneumoniae]